MSIGSDDLVSPGSVFTRAFLHLGHVSMVISYFFALQLVSWHREFCAARSSAIASVPIG